MTKIGIITDPHIISPEDPHPARRAKRRPFVKGVGSFKRVVRLLNEEGVGEVIIVGDLVDYYTDENRDFALGLLENLDADWHLTPGNHDYEVPIKEDPTDVVEDRSTAKEGWEEANVDLENRVLDYERVRFLLVESALSGVPEGTKDWLEEKLETERQCIVCTHVPLDEPEVVEAITSHDPSRDLTKYVQRKSPHLFEDCMENEVESVFSGHLHFPAEAEIGETNQYILPTCIKAEGLTYPDQGTVTIVDVSDIDTFTQVTIEYETDS